MRKIASTLALALLVAMASPVPAAQSTGEVRVSLKPVEEFSDVGRGLDRERNVQALQRILRALAPQLAAGELLTVEVLDAKLAGELRLGHGGQELRVLTGGADWPRLELKWTLARDGRELAAGHDRLADMNYLGEPLRVGQDGPLPYEARMIARWFDERVRAAAAR
ncbi:MAG: hypothetical protein AMXMBFR78_16800 [Rubrivivax sp.]|jgi:hypothetical protein